MRSRTLFCSALVFVAVTWHTSQAKIGLTDLPCEGSVKVAEGTWNQRKTVIFNIGTFRDVFLERGTVITQNAIYVGGVDLYLLIDRKCGRSRRSR